MSHPLRTPLETHLKRRHVLAGVGGVGLVAALPPMIGDPAMAATAPGSLWSDPATWGGQVPASGSVVTVKGAVVLDVDVSLAGLVIAAGASLTFAEDKSVTLTTTGNVVVYGLLAMKPGNANLGHRMAFTGVDETKYVGGGMDVLPSDVGLWVKDDGVLDLAGTPRTPWARALGSAALGSSTLTLDRVPVGWRAGDELVVCPTGSPRDAVAYTQFDEVVIKAVSGSTVTLSKPLKFAHPAVAVGDGKVMTAEVLNLTRNVRVEGTPGGRIHIWAGMCNKPQSVRHVALRHFGPRQLVDNVSTEVLGRYGFHLHMGYDAVRGSVLDGVVARDGGNHAFVPHLSNGVTLRGCVSYNTVETPFWWDGNPDTRTPGPPSDQISFLDCVAAKVLCLPVFRGYGLSGFQIGSGAGNVATGCVAVGVQGNKTSSGFIWPEANNPGLWVFRDNRAHNNKMHGIFVWQNSAKAHVVEQFTMYNNGAWGISHGAYSNFYCYRDGVLFGNAKGGIELHATSRGDGVNGLRFERLLIDGAGFAPYAVESVKHTGAGVAPTVFRDCRLVNHTQIAMCVSARKITNNKPQPDLIDMIDCTTTGKSLWLSDLVVAGSAVRVISPTKVVTVVPSSLSSTTSTTTTLAKTGTFDAQVNGYVTTKTLAVESPTADPTPVPEPVAPAPAVAFRLRRVQKPKPKKVVRRRRVVRSRRRRR